MPGAKTSNCLIKSIYITTPHVGMTVLLFNLLQLLHPQIQRLNEKLSSLSILSNRQSNGDLDAETARPAAVSRFFPFSVSRGEPRSTLDSMQVSLIDASLLLDSQSLLNAPD